MFYTYFLLIIPLKLSIPHSGTMVYLAVVSGKSLHQSAGFDVVKVGDSENEIMQVMVEFYETTRDRKV